MQRGVFYIRYKRHVSVREHRRRIHVRTRALGTVIPRLRSVSGHLIERQPLVGVHMRTRIRWQRVFKRDRPDCSLSLSSTPPSLIRVLGGTRDCERRP